jgi:pimeloyl-ACP methyl ester carboxylesterase
MMLARHFLSVALIALCCGCQAHRITKIPMDAIYDIPPGMAADRVLLVMLPGAKDSPEDMVERGLVRALRERAFPVDVVAADTHLDYYLEHSFLERLNHDIIAPAQAKGYTRIWLMGISLGGMGSLAYARAHPAGIEGVILLAPFLGTRGTIDEVVRAGGLSRWQPEGIKVADDEHALLAWLKNYRSSDPEAPKIFLGYGTDDRYAPASLLLAERLPQQQVMAIPGGHDWPTWAVLWADLLDRDPFALTAKSPKKNQF